MKFTNGAYWIKDGGALTLHAYGRVLAEADADLNHAAVYTPRGQLGKPAEEAVVVDLSKGIVAEIEERLGFGPLPILNKDGKLLAGARREMAERAQSFENWIHRPSENPAAEAKRSLDLAHEALYEAARHGALNARGADARLLCARASLALGEGHGLSDSVSADIREAAKALADAVGSNPVRQHIKLAEGAFHCRRATALAEVHGVARGRKPDAGAQAEPGPNAYWQEQVDRERFELYVDGGKRAEVDIGSNLAKLHAGSSDGAGSVTLLAVPLSRSIFEETEKTLGLPAIKEFRYQEEPPLGARELIADRAGQYRETYTPAEEVNLYIRKAYDALDRAASTKALGKQTRYALEELIWAVPVVHDGDLSRAFVPVRDAYDDLTRISRRARGENLALVYLGQALVVLEPVRQERQRLDSSNSEWMAAQRAEAHPVEIALTHLDHAIEALKRAGSDQTLSWEGARALEHMIEAICADIERGDQAADFVLESAQAAHAELSQRASSRALERKALDECSKALVRLEENAGADLRREAAAPSERKAIISGKIAITDGNPATDLWLHGNLTHAPDYTFSAKVYDSGSVHGLDGGRISKLQVWHKDALIMNYDRGWDQKPQSWKEKAVVRDIVSGFRGMAGDGPSHKAGRGYRSGQ